MTYDYTFSLVYLAPQFLSNVQLFSFSYSIFFFNLSVVIVLKPSFSLLIIVIQSKILWFLEIFILFYIL